MKDKCAGEYQKPGVHGVRGADGRRDAQGLHAAVLRADAASQVLRHAATSAAVPLGDASVFAE